MDMGREGEEFRAHRKEEKLMFFGMTFVEYDMVTLDEGGLARMEVADPATEDVVLPFKV